MKEFLKSAVIERYFKAKIQAQPGLWQEIQDYRAKSSSTGAKYATLFSIYDAVVSRKPRGIVECGTGLSTIVICRAIEDVRKTDSSYAPSFVSLESEEFYWKHANDLLPEKYKNVVEIRLSGLVDDVYGPFRGVRYENIPAGPHDFVFVDGPSYKTDKGGSSFCYDVLGYIQQSETPVYAIMDKRVSTVYVLQKMLGGKLATYNAATRVGKVLGATKHDLRQIAEPPSAHFQWSPFTGKLTMNVKQAAKAE